MSQTKANAPTHHLLDIDFDLSRLPSTILIPHLDTLSLHSPPPSWPISRKTRLLVPPFFAALLAAYSAGAYGLTSSALQARWNLSETYFNLGITVFVLGFGFAPVLLALISEVYGRYWVFFGSGVVFLLGTVGCAVTTSFRGMLVARLVTGSGASVFATLTGGVVSDLFVSERRNTAMTVYSCVIIMGTGVGPLVSGWVVQCLGWRWVFYLQIILVGVATGGLLVLFRETRGNVLLARNCAIINAHLQALEDAGTPVLVDRKKDGNDEVVGRTYRFRYSSPIQDSSIGTTIVKSFQFPLVLLATESIVFWFSMWVSFAWAILYMQFSSIALVYTSVYGFSSAQVGATYTAIIVGALVAASLCVMQDYALKRCWPNLSHRPESRLYFSCGMSLLLPAGLFWFGWTARAGVPWIVPTIAIGVFIVGIFVIYLAVFNYLADSYNQYASSALAAQSMCRNLLAGVFPLFTKPMFEDLGFGPAGSLLGGIAVLLCLVPWILCFYGRAIRERSALIRELASE